MSPDLMQPRNWKERLYWDVSSRMGRNKRPEHLSNVLKSGRQEEGLGTRTVETPQRLLRVDAGKNSQEKELGNRNKERPVMVCQFGMGKEGDRRRASGMLCKERRKVLQIKTDFD